MRFDPSLRVVGKGSSKTALDDITFVRRFHTALSTGVGKRCIFFYDKFTTCFAFRAFDWICAWECPENGDGDAELLVQRVDLDDDPVHAHFKFTFQLRPSDTNLPNMNVESRWMEINSKWNNVGRDNVVIESLFDLLRRNGYVTGTVDAIVELKFNKDTFFRMKQDHHTDILNRALSRRDLNADVTFTPLELLWSSDEFQKQSDFKITTLNGSLMVPRYILWLGFDFFRGLTDGDPNMMDVELPYMKDTISQVFEFAQKGKFNVRSLKEVNESLGSFVDCIAQLRPLEHESLLCNIESAIFDSVFRNWSTIELSTLVRLLVFARNHAFNKLYDSLLIFIGDTHYNRFVCEYTPTRNVEMYRQLLQQSMLWSIKDQRTKRLQKKTRRIIRYRENDLALAFNGH